jgi:hypothetical protein
MSISIDEQRASSSKTMAIISEIMEMLTGGKPKTKSFNPNNN